jgi:hypothetical protein
MNRALTSRRRQWSSLGTVEVDADEHELHRLPES